MVPGSGVVQVAGGRGLVAAGRGAPGVPGRDQVPQGGKMFRFMRYDVKLEPKWLHDELDLKVSDSDAERFRCMDNPAIVNEIYEIAKLAAAKQVKPEHWLGTLPQFLAAPGSQQANASSS